MRAPAKSFTDLIVWQKAPSFAVEATASEGSQHDRAADDLGLPSIALRRRAHAFVLQVYAATRAFPQEESYGLTSQFRRAAISIPANIAEGFRKQSGQDKARFLNISEGSLEAGSSG